MERLGFRHGRVFVDHERAGFSPEFVVGAAHLFDDFGMLIGDVGCLAGIGDHVEEIIADQAEALVAGGPLGPLVEIGLGTGGPAGSLGEEDTVGEPGFGAVEQGQEASSFDLVCGEFCSGDFGESGEDVEMGGKGVDIASGFGFSVPANEEGNAHAAFICAGFEPFLSGVVEVHGGAVGQFAERLFGGSGASSGHAVVGHKDQDGVVHEFPLVELGLKAAHVLIDVFDHAVEAGRLFLESEIGKALGVRRRCDEGTVGSVGGDVGEEGGVLIFLFLDPTEGGSEEEIGAVSLGFNEGAVVANDGVEVFVPGRVGTGAFVGLADAACAVDEDFVKATFVGLVGIFVTEVPLAKNAGGVACGFKHLGEDGGVERHALAFEDGVGDAVLERVATGHDGGAGRRAGGADEKAGEAGGVVVKGVQIGSLDPRVSVFADGAVALVIGHDEDDVGRGRGVGSGGQAESAERGNQKTTDHRVTYTS